LTSIDIRGEMREGIGERGEYSAQRREGERRENFHGSY